MERLIDHANVLNGAVDETGKVINKDAMLSIESYADIVDAIGLVQDELGITGTTAKEASTTIQGSLNAMKGAWSNLLVGIADDNADMGQLISNFTSSVATAAQNIIPRIQQILLGLGDMINQLAPMIAAALPELVSAILPGMLSAGINMILSLLQGIQQNIPALISAGGQALMMLLAGIAQAAPMIIQIGAQMIVEFANSISANPGPVLAAGVQAVMAIIQGLLTALPQVIMAGLELITNLVSGLINNFPQILEAGKEIVVNLWNGIKSAVGQLISGGKEVISAFISGIKGGTENADLEGVGTELGSDLTSGTASAVGESASAMTSSLEALGAMATSMQTQTTSEFTLLSGNVSTSLGEIGQSMTETADALDKSSEAADAAEKTMNAFTNALRAAGSKAVSAAQTIANNIRSSLTSKIGTIDIAVKWHWADGSGPKFATGLDYVPFDNFPAVLHKGETVLTASEAAIWRSGGNKEDASGAGKRTDSGNTFSGGITIVQNISSVPTTPNQLASATAAYFEQARWAI